MDDRRRLGDDERAAIGRAAGIPWQRVCPACGRHPAAVGVTAGGPGGSAVVADDPWLGCPACGEEWPARGVRHVVVAVPPPDRPELEAFVADIVAALRGRTGC
ncbi:MAG: hypothetical protein H6518_12280 [Microthrixaceae bacterium]|nr:hypothetical protein [Microthrixaceae bacterium]